MQDAQDFNAGSFEAINQNEGCATDDELTGCRDAADPAHARVPFEEIDVTVDFAVDAQGRRRIGLGDVIELIVA